MCDVVDSSVISYSLTKEGSSGCEAPSFSQFARETCVEAVLHNRERADVSSEHARIVPLLFFPSLSG